MYVSYIHLMYPINIGIQTYFLKKTGRMKSAVSAHQIIDGILFLLVIKWQYDWYTYQQKDPNNDLAKIFENDEPFSHQIFMMNIIYQIHSF